MSWRNLIWLSIILCLAGLALYLSRRKQTVVLPGEAAVNDLAAVVQAYKVIQKHSYYPLPAAKAGRGGIEGIVRQVDRFSSYIPPEQVASFHQRVEQGELKETGLRLAVEAGRTAIVGLLHGSPAKNEFLAGLEVLAIDDVATDDLSLQQAREMVATPAGGKVSLRLVGADGLPFVKEVKSITFNAETVTGIVRDESGKWVHALDDAGRFYYLRIGEFVRDKTPARLHEAYCQLDDPEGLVLDLRDNPGGGIRPAAEVADRFLTAGLIVRTVRRHGKPDVRQAHAAGTYPTLPLVVLIDGGTASGAEIVAGALQVHGRAVLLGRPSLGKWWLQESRSVGPGLGEIYLTVAECFLAEPEPAGPSPQTASSAPPAKRRDRPGLLPDVPVEISPAAREQLQELRLRALVAAPRKERPGAVRPAGGPARAAELKRSILKLDAQLARALELLRAKRVPVARQPGSRKRSLPAQ